MKRISAGLGQWARSKRWRLHSAWKSLLSSVPDAGEIERAIAIFAGPPNGGLIVTGSAFAAIHHDLITMLAGRHKLPAV